MNRCFPFFLLSFCCVSLVSCYYIRPIVTNTLISRCRCGLILPEAQCTSVFQTPEFECGLMTVYYTPTVYPDCSQAYVTCTKQGVDMQSVGIVGKVKNRETNVTEWSLLSHRKLTVNHQILTCGADGTWIREDLEANLFIHPLQIQCASSAASESFDYYSL